MIRTQQLLEETDDFIGRTEKMLDDFARDDAESEQIGRSLESCYEDRRKKT